MFQLFWRFRENDFFLHFNKPEYSSPKDVLCKVWLKSTNCTGEEIGYVRRLQTERLTDRRTRESN